MPINSRMDKTMAYLHNGKSQNNGNEQTIAMSNLHTYNVAQKKSTKMSINFMIPLIYY